MITNTIILHCHICDHSNAVYSIRMITNMIILHCHICDHSNAVYNL